MKLLFLIKTVTFTIFSFTYLYNKDENIISNSLANGKILDISLDVRPHRLLGKYNIQNELMNTRIQYKTNDNRQHHKLINGRDNNTYEKLKSGKPNNVEAYLNSHKSRYSKKSGLKKLDCYYEKKLFNSVNKIEKLIEHKNISKNNYKRIIYKKYGLPFLLLSLLPLLALGVPGIKTGRRHKEFKCTMLYKSKTHTPDNLVGYGHRRCEFEPVVDFYLMHIFLFVTVTIILSLIIYTYIKILKYKRIKSGMLK